MKSATIIMGALCLLGCSMYPPLPAQALTRDLFSVKFICGIKTPPPGITLPTAGTQNAVQPGRYSTAINLHNFSDNENVKIRVHGVIAKPGGGGEVSNPPVIITIPSMGALELDCPFIANLFDDIIITPDGGILLPPNFIKGFLRIESLQGQENPSLNVVVVYTVRKGEEVSIDVEPYQPGQTITVSPPVP